MNRYAKVVMQPFRGIARADPLRSAVRGIVVLAGGRTPAPARHAACFAVGAAVAAAASFFMADHGEENRTGDEEDDTDNRVVNAVQFCGGARKRQGMCERM